MNERSGEPVEISTRMRLGEWTRDSLAELVSYYQQKLREMGAADHEIETSVETPDDGGANVKVSWRHEGVRTCADMCQSIMAEAENSRGHGEAIPAGEATEDSKGLGAVFGDADRSAIDEPPTRRAMDALKNQVDPELMATTNDEGKA
ncbi:hypothetical protein [Arthrobacter glacialis]|uniref:hypothetical protein n=1 Tax=Arthrobacter glacialis TaxID=1664 RepID=UPI001FAF2B3E|nr:hypothetical protein [Arthrobacter glacialis]